mgnify:CR=1 FL=1
MLTDSRFGLTSGEICLLDCLNDARDDLRKLMKRWNERLIFGRSILWEEYVKGRLSIVCYVHLGTRPNCVQSTPGTYTEGKVGECVVIIVMCANARNFEDADRWNQQPVFINDVDFVEGPNGIIPSNIRFYDISDEVADVATPDLYFSITDGVYKFLPRISNRESAMLGRGAPSNNDNFTSHEVERGSEIVNGITENQWNTFGQRLGINACKISINAKTVCASFEKCGDGGVQLIDVLIGPFNL